MFDKIIQKKVELEKLLRQVENVKNEVDQLEKTNPQLVKDINNLTNDKTKLISFVNKLFEIEVPNLCLIKCVWDGLDEWPLIKSVTFKFDKVTNDFFYNLLIPFNLFSMLDHCKHPCIKDIKSYIFKEYDSKILQHNQNVKKLLTQNDTEYIKELLI